MQELKTLFPLLDEYIYSGFLPPDHGMKLFNLQNIADVEFAVASRHDIHKDFGPLRLPFPEVWFEFSDSAGTRYAIHTIEMDPEEFNDTERYEGHVGKVLSSRMYLKFAGCRPGTEDWELQELHKEIQHLLKVTDAGRAVGDPAARVHEESPLLSRIRGAEQLRKLSGVQLSILTIAYLGIGLVNCKNIETTRKPLSPTSSKKDRKKRRPPSEYRVIELPRPRYETTEGGSAGGGSTRLHAVRGHFKTYTAEKPLYGKLTGTWWWADHARGNIENGQVISNYEVGKRN